MTALALPFPLSGRLAGRMWFSGSCNKNECLSYGVAPAHKSKISPSGVSGETHLKSVLRVLAPSWLKNAIQDSRIKKSLCTLWLHKVTPCFKDFGPF